MNRNRKRYMAVGTLVLLLAAALLVPGAVRAAENDASLPGSGIRYPGGFDPNTVGDVTGKVSGVTLPEKGPVRFRIDTGKERYTVLASASWYWRDMGVDLQDGMEVRVRGSKSLGQDANLYVVAQKIRITGSGKSFSLRDSAGMPLWGGGNGMAGKTGGGMGSPRGGGMMGGGPGGTGAGGMGGGMRR
jgi:hypothetical protein